MMTFLQKILEEAARFTWLDWAIWLTAIGYVILSARQNVWGWVWGIVSCAMWGYASFFLYNLWLDALLQLFYVIMGFVGIYQWRKGSQVVEGQHSQVARLKITRLSGQEHLLIVCFGTLTSLLFGYFFDIYTTAAATYLDAFVTIFSIITTFLLVQKKLDNWAYWVVIDSASIYLFASRGAYLLAFIMLIYTIIAATAFFKWRKALLHS